MEKYLPDVITGEVIDILDPMIPLDKKVDPLVYYIDSIDKEIELCKEREGLWKEKRDNLVLTKDKVRTFLKEQVLIHGKQKTLEASVYVSSKDKVVIKEYEPSPEYFDYTVILSNLDINTYHNLVNLLDKNELRYQTNLKINEDKIPSEYKEHVKVEQLTIRKSKSSSD